MQKTWSWYGWIPILSYELLAENCSSEMERSFKKRISDTDLSQRVDVSLVFDHNNFLSAVQIDIPEVGTVEVSCKIERTGLVNFSFTGIKFSENDIDNIIFNNTALPVLILDIIRDVYHDHVHHDRHDDCKLKPVLSDNADEAVIKILSQYQNKIFHYHKDSHSIKDYPFLPHSKYFKMRRRICFLETARGEFTYAKVFIELHKSYLKSKCPSVNKNIKYFFDQAYNSVSILKEKLTWQIMYVISFLAVVITAMSLVSSIEPGFTLYHKIKTALTTPKVEQVAEKVIKDVNTKSKAPGHNQ